jgi:hypothetical protein
MARVVVLVCGGGNGAHVIAGLAAADPQTEVRVLTMFGDEAERWNNTLKTNDFTVRRKKHGEELAPVICKPDLVSKDPSCAKGCNLIILVVPAFAHNEYLTALKPYIGKGSTIIGLPGRAGFDFETRGILGPLAKDCTLVNFESLPWACRITEYGKEVDVLGTKECLSGAMEVGKTPPAVKEPVRILQRIVGDNPVLKVHGHILGMTLMAMNAYIHPSILYGRWHTYNGEELNEAPLFYQGIDQFAADTMSSVSDEVMATAKKIMTKHKDVDLTNVIHVFNWYLNCYADEMDDKSNLFKAITTNKAYTGLKHPMRPVDNDQARLVPDFSHRYFTEDVPYGLAVLRGICEAAGMETPVMDKVLTWMQSKLGKEYLKDGKIAGADVPTSRCPQRYGFNTLVAVVGK